MVGTLLWGSVWGLAGSVVADEYDARIQTAVTLAGDNASQIQKALRDVPPQRLQGMRFLVANMPPRDLKSLSSEFLLENVKVAYDAFDQVPWRDQIPQDVFLNDILPYCSVNERRDAWRADFYRRFQPLVGDRDQPGEVAAMLNREMFQRLNVKYSTRRRRADQGPFESIESGLASCTGLSVLLIDACRAVGVPARFVGTPRWSDGSGNHSWVEVWDDGWHFTGAAEPTGETLDQAWFVSRAATAQRDHRWARYLCRQFSEDTDRFSLGVGSEHRLCPCGQRNRPLRAACPAAGGRIPACHVPRYRSCRRPSVCRRSSRR